MAPGSSSLNLLPPLLNSANPWATTVDNLRDLYASPYTGGVTVRTSLLAGFPHDSSIHQYTFFSTSLGHATAPLNADGRSAVHPDEESSLNTLGYSPIPLQQYLTWLSDAASGKIQDFQTRALKPFIVSVTGSAVEVAECYRLITATAAAHRENLSLAMEINLSCPNIVGKPPPAYDGEALREYLSAVAEAQASLHTVSNSDGQSIVPVPVGIKTPPYTYTGQFQTLNDALETSLDSAGSCPITFITATNTLGGCLVVSAGGDPALGSANGMGIGGMAGDALHPLALGNVKTIREMLDASTKDALNRIMIIGVGGVKDAEGFKRMKDVGAGIVAVGTAVGREGVAIFEKIIKGLESVS